MSRIALSLLPCKLYHHNTISGGQQALTLDDHVPLTSSAGTTLPIPAHLLPRSRQPEAAVATPPQRPVPDGVTIGDRGKRDAPFTANISASPNIVDVTRGQDVDTNNKDREGAAHGMVPVSAPVPTLEASSTGGDHRDGCEMAVMAGTESTKITTNRGSVGDAAVTAAVVTSGSTVDRVLCVVQSSVVVAGPVAESGNNATTNNNAFGSARPAGLGKNEAASCPNAGGAEDHKDDHNGLGRDSSREKLTIPSVAVAVVDLSGTQLEQTLRLVLAGVSRAIFAARLRWCDVSNLRVYHQQHYHQASSEVPNVIRTATAAATAAAAHDGKAAGTENGGQESNTADLAGLSIERAFFLALAGVTPSRPAVTFVPVLGVAGGAHVCIHATAWNLDRLTTELWVRGAA